MHKMVLIIIAFCLGYLSNILVNNLVSPVHAEVAGMNYYDLKYDYDFKKAVENIVEGCSVDSYGDISC